MEAILHQLGDLLIGSVPTIVFFLILLGAYSVLVRKPLVKVLEQRHGRTGGAMDEARAAIASVEAKRRLRDARAEIFTARAARQKAASEARDRAVQEARNAAQQRILAARESVEQSGAEAKTQIEAGAAALSQGVLAAILPHRAGAAR